MYEFTMCGRYTDTRRDKAFLARMGCQAEFAFAPRFNIAPTQDAWLVAMATRGEPILRRARWGLIPSWAKDRKIGAGLINARAETVAVKPAFRAAYKKRRCLVLADGFYEWKKTAAGKKPVYFRLREGQPFVFGGLWEEWRDSDRTVESFCIVTVAPNELCAAVHDRMPLIVPEPDAAAWLDPASSREALDPLLRPYDASRMESLPDFGIRSDDPGPPDAAAKQPRIVQPPAQIQLTLDYGTPSRG